MLLHIFEYLLYVILYILNYTLVSRQTVLQNYLNRRILIDRALKNKRQRGELIMIGPEKRHRMNMRYKELTEMYPNLSHFKKDRIIYEEFLNIDKKDYKSTFKTDLCTIIFAYSVIALVYLL